MILKTKGNSMFKRKIFNRLSEQNNRSNGSSALLVEGARRVGKTTAVEFFAKNEFKDYILIDFSIASKLIIDTFNDLSNVDKFFERLFLVLEIKPLPKGSLIIFDEIQFCQKARQAIKTLVADKRYFLYRNRFSRFYKRKCGRYFNPF